MDDNLTLEDLEKMSGLPIRTIRYYIQEGLLWGPDTKGKFATYSQEHLERLGLIEALTKRTHLPLKEIRRLLDHADPEQLQQIQEIMANPAGQVVIIDTDQGQAQEEEGEQDQQPKAGDEALAYLNKINWVSPGIKEPATLFSQDAFQNNLDPSSPLPWANQNWSRKREEHWQRITLYEGVELHIRAPRERKSDTQIRELLDFARKLFRS